MKKSDIKPRHVYLSAYRERLAVVGIRRRVVTFFTVKYGRRRLTLPLGAFAALVVADVTPKTNLVK